MNDLCCLWAGWWEAASFNFFKGLSDRIGKGTFGRVAVVVTDEYCCSFTRDRVPLPTDQPMFECHAV
jgi:hypothetical protein